MPARAFNYNAPARPAVRAMPNFNTRAAQISNKTTAVNKVKQTRRTVRLADRFKDAHDGPRPINAGFGPGGGANQTHRAGTVLGRIGSPHGHHVTTHLNANAASLALPYSARGQPMRYYRLTRDVRAPTGAIGAGYGAPGGATQIVLNQSVVQSGMQRTITPNFSKAVTGWAR